MGHETQDFGKMGSQQQKVTGTSTVLAFLLDVNHNSIAPLVLVYQDEGQDMGIFVVTFAYRLYKSCAVPAGEDVAEASAARQRSEPAPQPHSGSAAQSSAPA